MHIRVLLSVSAGDCLSGSGEGRLPFLAWPTVWPPQCGRRLVPSGDSFITRRNLTLLSDVRRRWKSLLFSSSLPSIGLRIPSHLTPQGPRRLLAITESVCKAPSEPRWTGSADMSWTITASCRHAAGLLPWHSDSAFSTHEHYFSGQ